MRVVFLSPAAGLGGAERVLLAALRGVPEHLPGFAPAVVLLADGPLAARAAAAGADVSVVPLPPALAGVGDTQLRDGNRRAKGWALARAAAAAAGPGVRFLRRLRDAVRRFRPHLIHSNGLKTHLLSPAVRPRGVPVTWHVHDFYSERPLAGRLVRRLAGRAAGGVAISAAVARDLAGLVPGWPTWTVLNGVDVDHYSPGPGDGAGFDRLAGLPPAAAGTVRVGLVATYANWKGHGVFLDALARLPAALPVRGYVVGGPIYATAGSQVSRAELERRVAALGLAGRVGFVPFQPDPAPVYRSLDVVVHASTRPEPFGLTVAEGMSCGRAVIAAAAGGAVELFADGVDALGHRPGDADSLAEAVSRLASDPTLRDRLGRTARATAVARFGLSRFGKELAAVFAAGACGSAGSRLVQESGGLPR